MSVIETESSRWATHRVLNQPPPLAEYDPFAADVALAQALTREGGEWGLERVRDLAIAARVALDERSRGAQLPPAPCAPRLSLAALACRRPPGRDRSVR